MAALQASTDLLTVLDVFVCFCNCISQFTDAFPAPACYYQMAKMNTVRDDRCVPVILMNFTGVLKPFTNETWGVGHNFKRIRII